MDSTGPAAGTTFTDSNGFTASTAGAVYSGLNVNGGIDITADNVTIENSTVTEVNPDTAAIQVASNVTGVKIVNDSIHGTNTVQSGALAFAVSYFGSSISGVTIDHTNFYNGDRILAGYGTVTNSYCLGGADFDSTSGGLEHDECVYTDGGAPGIRALHDTLINANPNQTAAIFVDNPDFGGGGTSGTVDVEDSLLAGGDYCIYAGAGNAGSVAHRPGHDRQQPLLAAVLLTAGQYGPEAYCRLTRIGQATSGTTPTRPCPPAPNWSGRCGTSCEGLRMRLYAGSSGVFPRRAEPNSGRTRSGAVIAHMDVVGNPHNADQSVGSANA